MQFRTKLQLRDPSFTFNHSHSVFSMGSCFAQEISSFLIDSKFDVLLNPFGILFHPIAMKNALSRIHSTHFYTEEEIFEQNDTFFSWDHHSKFNHHNKSEILRNINQNIKTANQFIQKSEVFIFTFGTSWAYKLKQIDMVVANCHKVNSNVFEKTILPLNEIESSIRQCVNLILEMQPNAKIILSVSPIRHKKDGLIENTLSKSQLIYAAHQIATNYENVEYFPSYEFLFDDLRDYRFYKEDLIHPNKLAIKYIWNEFKNHYFGLDTKKKLEKIQKLNLSLHHKPNNSSHIQLKEFYSKTLNLAKEINLLLPQNTQIQKDVLSLEQRVQNL